MSPTPNPIRINAVRTSRDGDQFHYLWAARRCLLLLAPASDLVAISIEGASVISETVAPSGGGIEVTEADEIIDVAEYHGSEDLGRASAVRYAQLKHSTLHADQHWPPSGLEKTLNRFADKFRDLEQRLGASAVRGRFEFAFISNRPVDQKLIEAVEDIAKEKAPRHLALLEKLRHYTALDGEQLTAFARALQIENREEAYLLQRQNLVSELSAYLPDADVDAPIQLKELVTRKALSESAANNVITKQDVLRALGTDIRDLFPAENRLERLTDAVTRTQESVIVEAIVTAGEHPVLVHAEGGVGKSVFVSRLAAALPAGSECVVYDSFGNGVYRSPTGYRHPHKVALVQIANELTSVGLCHPLIPSPKSDNSSYLKAFLHRLTQAADAVRKSHSADERGFVCVVIDAADNAELAAQEIGTRSFARDLIRERIPAGVRFVFVTRTHRQSLLDPPRDAVRLELLPFDQSETADHLRRSFPLATNADAAEFQRLTTGNPRVQSLALAASRDLHSVLRSLGPEPTTVESSIKAILDAAVDRLKDSAPSAERTAIDTICTALATLRPLIPIGVLAKMSGVDASAIRSFAFDIGRPLLVADDTIRFRDEPAETWFRQRFRPTSHDLRLFVERLKPLASGSVYVASAFPQLMLEAGMLDELLNIALDEEVLPNTSALDRRDVELQRLQFALKASLRARRWTYAAKLALKGGTATAGNDRQRKLLQENTDVAGIFMQPDHILEVVSRREFGDVWVGSHHAFDAGILSVKPALVPEARSHLRMANEWLRNWSRLPKEEREHERATDGDIAEMALAFLNIVGVQNCADWLRTWRPRSISYSAGRIVASRLVDHARYHEASALAIAAGNNISLVLAVNHELRRVGRGAPAAAVRRTVSLLQDRRLRGEEPAIWDREAGILDAVVDLVVEAHREVTHPTDMLARLITKYLPSKPPNGLSSRHNASRRVLLRAYALRSALSNEPLSLIQFAGPELLQEIERPKAQYHQESSDLQELRTTVGALLPWHVLWARNVVQRVASTDVDHLMSEVLQQSDSTRARTYREDTFLNDEIAQIWFEILLDQPDPAATALAAFDKWANGLKASLWTRTLTALARQAARHPSPRPHTYAISYATTAATAIEGERAHAEGSADDLLRVARALLALSQAEAAAYFDAAVQVVGRVGDENLNRWSAAITLGNQASNPHLAKPELAYRFARSAEVTYDYVARDKHFEWRSTVEALAGLCPRSCLAIASRWRDRNFGNPARVLPLAMEFLMRRHDVDARAVQSLTGIRAYWDKGAILGAALADARDGAERFALWNHAMRYAHLEPPPAQTWATIKTLQMRYGFPAEDVDAFLSHAQHDEDDQPSRPHSVSRSDSASRDPNWDAIFANADLTTLEGAGVAHQRFMSGDAPYNRERFYQAATLHVPTGGEAAFVAAVGALSNFDSYDCRTLFESLPPTWRSQRGLRSASAQVVLGLCTKRWTEITLNRYWQALPMALAIELSGLELDQIVEVVLASAGESAELFDSDRMFTLVGLVATKLDDVAAQDALEYGLDQFDSVLKDTDGDGPWSRTLAPPGDLGNAIAGYLWAGLGNPRDTVRWETAHAVLGLCAFGNTELIKHLVDFAASGSGAAGNGGQFADATLFFYRYNAVQWLVIALLRAAAEYPDAVAPHLGFLTHLVLEGEPHILLRHLAARASLAIDDRRPGSLDSSLRARLESVNVSPFVPVVRTGHRRVEDTGDGGDEDEDDGFFFGIDIGPYWFEPLARIFGVSGKEIERRARHVMRDEWNVHVKSRWDADERARRKMYRESEDDHSHGSRPRSDNLHFYLSYHAMMVVAGQLLAVRPVVQHTDDDDDFAEWLASHSLTRDDGRWLADRRDPTPLERSAGSKHEDLDNWRWSLARSDFDAQLFRADGRITMSGRWTSLRGSRAETVSIDSALVTPERSRSLLAALQTTTDAHDYGLPDDNDRLEIASGGYELRGWITTLQTSRGIDDRDPWSGEISYPGSTPAPYVNALVALTADKGQRVWRRNGDRSLVSLLWGSFPEGPERDEVEHGQSLHASTDFVRSLLRAAGKHLIVKVSIERRYKYGRYEPYSNRRDEGVGPLLPSVRVFLIERDGHVRTI